MKRRKIKTVITALTLAFIMAVSPMLAFAENATENFEVESASIDLPPVAELSLGNLTSDRLSGNLRDTISDTANSVNSSQMSSLPFPIIGAIGGKATGSLTPGQGVIYRMPPIYQIEVNNNRLYSFALQMPSNADFDLYLIDIATGDILASDLKYSPGQNEFFWLTFPSWVVGMDLGILVHSFSGSGAYTVYAGPTWIGVNVQGTVSIPGGGMGFNHYMNWSAPGTWNLDLRNNPSLPKNSYMTSLSIYGTVGGGNINRQMTLVDQGGTISGMFTALPIPTPSFRSGNTWHPNPVSGVWADQRLNFTLSLASPGAWTATQLSMGVIFPVTLDNLKFV